MYLPEKKQHSFLRRSWFALVIFIPLIVGLIVTYIWEPEIGLPVAIAFAPGLTIAWIVYIKDRYDREPLNLVMITILLGVIIAIPVVFAELYLLGYFTALGLLKAVPSTWGEYILSAFIMGFAIAGFVEETFKYFAVRIGAYHSKEFNEERDGVVYCVSAAVGFATIENVLYVLQGGVPVAVIRAFTSVPLHCICGAYMGYFLSMNKFHKKYSLMHILGVPIFLHGLYNFLIMTFAATSLVWLSFLSPFLIVIGSFAFLRPRIKELNALSEQRRLLSTQREETEEAEKQPRSEMQTKEESEEQHTNLLE